MSLLPLNLRASSTESIPDSQENSPQLQKVVPVGQATMRQKRKNDLPDSSGSQLTQMVAAAAAATLPTHDAATLPPPPRRVKLIQKFDPDIISLWKSSKQQVFRTRAEIQQEFEQFGAPAGAYFSFNGNENDFYFAYVVQDGQNKKMIITKMTLSHVGQKSGIQDNQGTFFSSFQALVDRYQLNTPLSSYRDGKELIARGFARGFLNKSNYVRDTLRLHRFSDEPVKPASQEQPSPPLL